MRADFDKIRDRICKDKRDRGADGKTAVFGLLKRNGKVFAGVIKDAKRYTYAHHHKSKSLKCKFHRQLPKL